MRSRLRIPIGCAIAISAILLNCACASAPRPDPTPAAPIVACVGNPLGTPTPNGRLLPTAVVLVGVYNDELYWGMYANSGPKPVLVRRDEVHFVCRGMEPGVARR